LNKGKVKVKLSLCFN